MKLLWKILSLKHIAMALNLGERGRATRHALGLGFPLEVSRDVGPVLVSPCYRILDLWLAALISMAGFGLAAWVRRGVLLGAGSVGCALLFSACGHSRGIWEWLCLSRGLDYCGGGGGGGGFNFCFSGVFCWCWRGGHFGGGLGAGLSLCGSMWFGDFPDFSQFPKILRLKSLGNSSGKLHIPCV